MNIEERLNQAESTAKKALEEVAEARRMLEKAGPWIPKIGEGFYHVINDGFEWKVRHRSSLETGSETLIRVGNCYRTEQEAQEVATQRNFMTERNAAGDLAPNAYGFVIVPRLANPELRYFEVQEAYGERKFSTVQLARAWVEKWGGESAVVARLQKGWV